MSMESIAWNQMYRRMSAPADRREFSAGSDARGVVILALVIAGVAVLDAAMGLVTRWLSAGIGEALILDLRTAVFDHVQRMPIAFFTRTRTGALVSRLHNDVIAAQP